MCVGDAEAVGACAYGIRSWCASTGLDYDAGCAPGADVLAAYAALPVREARLAILHALRHAQKRAA